MDPGTSSGHVTARKKRKDVNQMESVSSADPDGESITIPKRRRTGHSSKAEGKKKAAEPAREHWPEHFNDLFKASDCWSVQRRNLILFSTTPVDLQALLKRPLDLEKVAELKALLPDLIKFAYVPRNLWQINADLQTQKDDQSKGNKSQPCFSDFAKDSPIPTTSTDDADVEEEHVLVLDFITGRRSEVAEDPANGFSLPPALTPAAVKKLVEKRNERFVKAVEELLQIATPGEAVVLVQSAAREHVPVDPKAFAADGEPREKASPNVPTAESRPSIDRVIEDLQEAPWYSDQIVYRKLFPECESRTGELSFPLSPEIKQALAESRKIASLYTHQAEAIDAVHEGKHVIVSTSTASGKSIIYQVPTLRFLQDDPSSKAIFIYPTKALAQDQKAALEQLLWSCPGLQHHDVFTYDGDTPTERRRGIRESASVIFTNFDMLHLSILPHEEEWRQFFKNLKLVAVDELHYYSGVFGSHVALIMRRLRRICAAVGNRRVRFISCSATIARPLKHMKSIFGVDDIEVVTDDGAPSGRKEFLVWNPGLVDALDPSAGRTKALAEATRMMRFLMKRGVRTILFCKIRKVCELAMKTLRIDLTAEGRHDILERVAAYRGGYSQQDRRKVEQDAFSGSLLGLVATNALELGVDIGTLDAVIMLGFPFSVASLRQQSGRAGRRARDALSVLIAEPYAADKYYVQNPSELFEKTVDEQNIDWENKVVLEAHLQCAALEMPLSADDDAYFGPSFSEICEHGLRKDKDGWYHTNPKYMPYPSKHISIRGIKEDRYTVIDVSRAGHPKVLEEIEFSRALFETYEGGVFLHQGFPYIVREVSHDSKIAKLVRADVDWTTRPRDFTDVDAAQTYRIREIKGSPVRAFYGRVELKTLVFGFFKIRNGIILDRVDLDTPPFERSTTGFWVDVPTAILDIFRLKTINAAEAIHSAAHAFLNQFSMAKDVHTECKVAKKEYMEKESNRKRPGRLIFYDAAGTDGAIAAKAFDHVSNILSDAFEAVESCECHDGCNRCIVSPYCKENNIVSSKLGAQILLRGVLSLPIDVDAIPDPEITTALPETIIKAGTVRAVEGVEVELYTD